MGLTQRDFWEIHVFLFHYWTRTNLEIGSRAAVWLESRSRLSFKILPSPCTVTLSWSAQVHLGLGTQRMEEAWESGPADWKTVGLSPGHQAHSHPSERTPHRDPVPTRGLDLSREGVTQTEARSDPPGGGPSWEGSFPYRLAPRSRAPGFRSLKSKGAGLFNRCQELLI